MRKQKSFLKRLRYHRDQRRRDGIAEYIAGESPENDLGTSLEALGERMEIPMRREKNR
jgi:hypothetical protein